MRWDPDQYLQFAAERGRPFDDLLAPGAGGRPGRRGRPRLRPGQPHPHAGRPLAAGAGRSASTRLPEMVQRAVAEGTSDRLGFAVGDLRDWRPDEPVDVLVSNATLQWVPDHLALLPSLVEAVRPGGWFAFQVPGNFGDRSHTAMAEVATSPRWRERFDGRDRARPAVEQPAAYLDRLAGARLHGGRLGDDVPARAPGTGRRRAVGQRHRAAAVPAGARRRRASGTRSWPTTARWSPRPTRSSRGGRCCRSGASSSSRSGRCSRDRPGRPAPRAARGPGRVRGGAAPVLRRDPRHDRGGQAAGARGPWRSLVPGRRARAAPRCGGRLPAGPQGAPGAAGRRPRRRSPSASRPQGVDVTWDDKFPGFRRCYVADPHGNRIELLEPLGP